MADKHDRLQDDVAAYAAGPLDPIERSWTEAHLRRCTACTGRLEGYQAVLTLLPHALTPETPPAWALATLLSEARRRRAISEAARARPEAWEAWWRGPLGIRPFRWVTVAVCAGLLGWNLALHRQLANRAAPVPVEQLARLPDGRVVALIGTGTPGASARLYVAEDGQRGELAIAGLPALPPERVYQLWFARPGAPPVSGGVFRVDVRGAALAVVVIPVALEPARAVAVTEEPAPGSLAPTGLHLLDRRI